MAATAVDIDANTEGVPTRTRKLGQKQSKYACRTCKQRRVKCDEQFPSCLRCLKSGRECDGYQRISKSQDAEFQRCLGLQQSPGSPNRDFVQQPMLRLTLDFFTCDPYRFHNRASAQVFQIILPQLAMTQPCVTAAAVALGAAYNLCILKQNVTTNVAFTVKLYLAALRQIQAELRRKDPEIMPLLMAATLLAAAESVQDQQDVAFDHVSGAFGMAHLRSQQSGIKHIEGFDSLLTVFNCLDQHICIFIWGRIPDFPLIAPQTYMRDLRTIEDLVAAQPALHQHCLHVIGNAAHSIPCSKMLGVRHELVSQQHHLVASLRRWLSAYDFITSSPETIMTPSETRHLRLLKAQMLCTFIATSNIKPSTQASYDTYAPQFDEIIQLCESILGAETNHSASTTASPSPSPLTSNSPSTPTNLTPFSPVQGIIHPLSFTARKYRAPIQRRRAIALLSRAGIEGPLHAPFEVLVASHIVALEEQGHRLLSPSYPLSSTHWPPVMDNALQLSQHIPQNMPPEENRICVAWIIVETDKHGSYVRDETQQKQPQQQQMQRNPLLKPNRRLLRVCRKRRGPLVFPDEPADGMHPDKAGGMIRMVDGDGICAEEDLADVDGVGGGGGGLGEGNEDDEAGIETIEI